MKIAIVRLSALGDIVQSMIVIQFIKKNFPIAEIDWFVEEKFAKVLELNNDIHKTYKVNLSKKNILGFFLEIYRLKRKYKKLDEYDLTVDLQGLIKSAIVSKIIPSKKIFGFDKHSCREGLAAYLYSSSYYVDYDHNVIKRYIELTAWSLNISSSTFDIYDKKKIIQENDADISKPRYGLFVIGASFSSKQYSIENFAIVAKSLNIDIIVLWGSQSEKELAENLSLSSKNITVSEKLNLIELVKLINDACFVLGGDTGPTHIAWAQNIPSVTLFGSTPAYRNCFETNNNLALSSESFVNIYKINKSDFSINDIKPETVVSAINRILI